jgi:hypothetical protein
MAIEPAARRPTRLGGRDRQRLRVAAGSGRRRPDALPVAASVAPHALQKRAGSGTAVPHEAHTVFGGPVGCATCAPHSRQKRSPRRYSPLQEGQTSGAAEG